MQVHQTPTLLLTRPAPASERFAKGITGAEVVIAPLMEIVGTGAKVALEGVQALILTSDAAVPFVPQAALPAYCVGPRTTHAAQAAGFDAQQAGQTADELVETLTKLRPKGSILHLHGTHTRGDVAERLSALGLRTTGVAIYDQRECTPTSAFHTALTRPNLIVPLFSPRSAKLFATAAPALRPDTILAALSTAVADALPPQMRAQTRIAAAPTGEEMLRAMEPLGVQRNSP